jgi:hypothetical protein
MTAAALVTGLLGLIGTFMPDVVLSRLGAAESPLLLLLVQVSGALYMGFAAVDWMARDNLIGGIYSRPVAIGNLMHFLVAGLAMIRELAGTPASPVLWILTLVYTLLAAGFGTTLFRHPLRQPS